MIIPTQLLTVEKSKKYLKDRDQPIPEGANKKILLEKAKAYHKTHPPKTIVEIEAEKEGHKVLFLPPYHPELSPIEYCWARVKLFIAENSPYNINDICDDFPPKAFVALNSTMIKNTFLHVKAQEEKYRNNIDQEKEEVKKKKVLENNIDQSLKNLSQSDNLMQINLVNDLDVAYSERGGKRKLSDDDSEISDLSYYSN